MPRSLRIPGPVARKLGHYVYVYVDPLDDRVFYVGKGKGQRALAHLSRDNGGLKAAVLRRIRKAGRNPRIEVLAHGLPDAKTALRIEAAVIDVLGLGTLTNQMRGWKSLQYGRVPLTELIDFYQRRRVSIREPSILIRINQLYRPGMTSVELYDATRGIWKVGPRRSLARLAFAVFEGVVREVYAIRAWFPGGTTFTTREHRKSWRGDRWEFVGQLAPDGIRRRYIGRYVGQYFARGAQNPIVYANVQAHRTPNKPIETDAKRRRGSSA